jgi:precorrin-6B methylase 2
VTGLERKAENLSRKARNCDRFEVENGKVVKKNPEL